MNRWVLAVIFTGKNGVMEIYRFGLDAMGGAGEAVMVSESKEKALSIANLALEEVARIELKY